MLLLLAGAIAGYLATSGGETRRPLAWRDITSAVGQARWAQPTISIIRDRRKLDKILRVATLPPHPSPPAIDFTRRQAILIAAGPRSSSGYTLRVEKVTEKGGRIDVLVRERTPALSEHVIPGLTYPFRLITLEANHKHVHVRYAGRS